MGNPPAVALLALGCPKNLVDSERLLAAMALAGYRPCTDPAAADVTVITTCAFLESAVRESEAAIREILTIKRHRAARCHCEERSDAAIFLRPAMKVVVAGCLVQRFGPRIRRRLPGVDLFVGIDQLTDIPRLLKQNTRYNATFPPAALATSRSPRLLCTPGHFAYLKIADGCDNRCAYCLIPAIRGRLRSRSVPDLVSEAEALARIGVRELIVIAQDTTAYGAGRYKRPALARLLRKLGTIRGIDWLRLMYTHPAHITEDVIREFASNPSLCRYIDLPIQHVSDRILRRMGRGYGRTRVEQLLESLRAIPDMHIRTTVLVGFPGETEQEFEELLCFIRQARFNRLGAYAFSAEPGTRAHRMPDQIPAAVRQSRLRELMRVQAGLSRRNLHKLAGQELRVLMDTPTTGRTEWDAPEIDGVVKLRNGKTRVGDFVQVQVTRTGTHDIHARLVPTGR